MIRKLLENDIRHNKLLSGATVFFMTVSAMLIALTALLFSGLTGAVDDLMERAQVPDYMQMHTGSKISWEDEERIFRFAKNCETVQAWQISPFLNLDNSGIMLGGRSLADSTQDNGLAVQGKTFDYLLDVENEIPDVLPGEVYVPVCYRSLYDLSVGDAMIIRHTAGEGDQELMIAGFIRDAQMNSMMASSKRFLVHEADYEKIKGQEEGSVRNGAREEYLIEFLLAEGADINAFGTAYAAAELPANGPAVTKPLVRMMNGLSDGTMIFVIFLAGIVVLLISLLCIRFMLLLQMERDRKEVGMLKALGIGKVQICGIYFAKYILFSACGMALGLPAACFLKIPLEKQIRELYGASPGGLKMILLALLSVLAAEGILLLSVRHSLKKTEKLTVLDALFRAQEKKRGKGQSCMVAFVVAGGIFLALVPRNLYSTMSAPEFVTYMGIGQAQIRMDVRQPEGDIHSMEGVDTVLAGDGWQTDRSGTAEQIAQALARDAQVERYALLRTLSCVMISDEGKAVNLAVETGDHSLFPIIVSEGKLPEEENEIALSSMNAEELGLGIGETMHLKSGTEEADYTVCGIYADITNGGKTAKAYRLEGDAPVVWSVLYVSLKDDTVKEHWMEEYQNMGADVIDLADYVQGTYGQTLKQLQLASRVALGISLSVIFVVVMLFTRMTTEQERYLISLHKALGFTGIEIRRGYFLKGMFLVMLGTAGGILAGILCGERLCGTVLQSFGAAGFQFVISTESEVLCVFAFFLTGAAALWTGTAEIKKVGAFECCRAL